MKQISAEVFNRAELSPEDAKNIVHWLWEARDKTQLTDPGMLNYPLTGFVRVGTKDNPLFYVPVHPVFMMESEAPQPGLSAGQKALCYRYVRDKLDEIAQTAGFGEVYFLTRDPSMVEFVSEHGYEEVPNFRVMRRKVPPKD